MSKPFLERPDFTLIIDGKRISSQVPVQSITFCDRLNEPATLEIIVDNEPLTEERRSRGEGRHWPLGMPISLSAGYDRAPLSKWFVGHIGKLTPSFPGHPTTVRDFYSQPEKATFFDMIIGEHLLDLYADYAKSHHTPNFQQPPSMKLSCEVVQPPSPTSSKKPTYKLSLGDSLLAFSAELTADQPASSEPLCIGRGKALGLPTLRAGMHMAIDQVDPICNGLYHVSSATHIMAWDGYTTWFEGYMVK